MNEEIIKSIETLWGGDKFIKEGLLLNENSELFLTTKGIRKQLELLCGREGLIYVCVPISEDEVDIRTIRVNVRDED